MTRSPPNVVLKVRKLAQLAEALRQGKSFPITRLTSLKRLIAEPAANRFVVHLARKALEQAEKGQRRSSKLPRETNRLHLQLMAEALAEMEDWPDNPSDERRRKLLELLRRCRDEQNEQKPIPFGVVRLIRDWELLIVEKALNCLLHPREAEYWVYQVARDYTERYDPQTPYGLVRASAPLVQDIVDFCMSYFELDPAAVAGSSPRKSRAKTASGRGRSPASKPAKSKPSFTPRQGQYLAFIHHYRQLHRQGPAEVDLAQYFQVTPPAVHGMIVKLEELGLVTREKGVPRSINVNIPKKEIPPLEASKGPAW